MGSVNGSVELHGPPALAQRRGPAAPPPDVRRVGVAAFPGRDTCLPSTINSPQAYAQAVRFCCFDERANLRHLVRGTSATAPGPGNAPPRHPGHGRPEWKPCGWKSSTIGLLVPLGGERDVASLAEEAGKRTKAGAVFNEGDVLRPKLATVKLLAQPSEQSDAVATLAKGDEVIFLGKEQDGFVNVESAKGGGWVKKVLVGR